MSIRGMEGKGDIECEVGGVKRKRRSSRECEVGGVRGSKEEAKK